MMYNVCVQLWPRGFCCSYNPYDGPNEHPEAELPLVAGKYLYVYGTMDEDGFYEGPAQFSSSSPLSLLLRSPLLL